MIALLGLNHKSATIEVRERLVFCEEDVRRFSSLIIKKGFSGLVVLSTCNRTEFYFEFEENFDSSHFNIFEETLFNYRNLDNSISKHFYRKENQDAAHHLFTVVSGLDSMILGEYQIVGQIKEAFKISENLKINSASLTRLFNKSLEAGKKVRTETSLNKGAVSVSSAAIELAGKTLNNLCSHYTLLIGAGQTGELTIQNLVKKGCDKFTVINRTFEKADELAKKYNGQAREFAMLDELLVTHDIIISSTASKKPIITVEMVKNAMLKRNNKSLFFVDLSVPRNIEKEVSEIENVYVYDIDALNVVIEDNFEQRKGKIQQAEKIIQHYVSNFVKWQNTRNLIPTFNNISSYIQELNQNELESFVKKDDSGYQKAVEYGDQLTTKLIHSMIQNVKSITDHGKKQEYLHMVNDLFNLN